MARWALTGAGGYIGRHLATHLLACGHAVRGLQHKNAPADGVQQVSGSILDPDAVARLVDSADVVVHLAAFVHKRSGSKRQQVECRQLNVDGTRLVTERCRDAGASLVNVSTANVYPSVAHPVDERTQPQPRTLYGETKLEAEQLVSHEIARGLCAVTVRPAMVFGPHAPGNLPRLVRMVRCGVVPLIGGGGNRKTMTSVARLARAITLLGEQSRGITGQTFNVGGLTMGMKEVIDLIADELKVRARVLSVPSRPLRALGQVADVVTRGLRLPSFLQMVESFESSSEVDDSKLESWPGFRDPTNELDELRSAIRSFSASR